MSHVHYLGKKVCGPETMERTVKCLCENGEKRIVVTPYWVEKKCRIDHNQAEACLEALEAEDYGQLCRGEVPDEDERSAWELVPSGPGKKWIIDPPAGEDSGRRERGSGQDECFLRKSVTSMTS